MFGELCLNCTVDLQEQCLALLFPPLSLLHKSGGEQSATLKAKGENSTGSKENACNAKLMAVETIANTGLLHCFVQGCFKLHPSYAGCFHNMLL